MQTIIARIKIKPGSDFQKQVLFEALQEAFTAIEISANSHHKKNEVKWRVEILDEDEN